MGGRKLAIACVGLLAAILGFLGPESALGQSGDQCLQADPPPLTAPPNALRFGITPLAAGSAGASQLQPKPEDSDAALGALTRLRPERKQLILRLNRMFMADGEAGIQRFAAIVDRYAKAGF